MPNRPTVPNDITHEPVMRAWYQALQNSIEDLSNERISVKDYGAYGDGVKDDTASFNAAITAAVAQSSVLWIPTGNYRLTSTITLADPITIVGDGKALSILAPFLGAGGGDLFEITSDDVYMMDFGFDGDNVGTVTLTNDMFMIHANPTSGTLKRLIFKNLQFTNFDFSAGTKDVSSLSGIRAAYGIKLEDTNRAIIENCCVDTISGGLLYTTGCNYIDVNKCYIKDALIVPIWIHDTTNYFNITGNYFDPADAQGVFLGGLIEVSSASGAQCHHGNISDNFVKGSASTQSYVSYGAVIRVLSSTDINISNNYMAGIADGSLNLDMDFLGVYHIRIGTYGTSSSDDNGPCKRINIDGNYIIGTNDTNNGHISGIYIENDFQTSRVPATDIKITKNQMYSQSAGTGYLSRGISLNGNSSGIQNVIIEDNNIIGYPEDNTSELGIISIRSTDTTGKCAQIFLGGNRVESLRNVGGGPDSNNACIVIGNYTSDVLNTKPNYLVGYSYGLVVEASAGSNLWYLDDNIYEPLGVNNTKFVFNVQPKSRHANFAGNTASRPTSTDYLTNYMTYFDTDLGTPLWYNGSSWVGAWGSADFAEAVSDQVGTMVTGNTETGITVTYQDSDNTLDFVVSDTTVAGDTGSTGMTPGDTLTIAGGTNITTAMSGDTLTINNDYTDETIQDLVGAMTTGNTETGITVSYQDSDGTIDFVVSDLTVAGDSGSTGMTPGDTLTVAGGTGITTAMSGDTLTITATGGSSDDSAIKRSWYGI